MGSWGVGVEDDDYFADVYGEIERSLRDGLTISEAASRAVVSNQGQIDDEDEGPVFWLALAKAQWTYGALSDDVLETVRSDIETGRGMARWIEAGESTAEARRNALARFLKKISTPRARPKAPPKAMVRKPKFAEGDCLAILHPDGRYGAAIVTVADHAEPECGMNLVCTLAYLDSVPPPAQVFEDREWLRLPGDPSDHRLDCTWYSHVGFRAARARIRVVARTQIRTTDPRESDTYLSWKMVGARALR